MSPRMVFWTVSGVIFGVFLVVGFGLVPYWSQWSQSPDQRIRYLERAIWCPI